MTLYNIFLQKQKIIPCDIDQFHYVIMITIIKGSIIVLPDELFNLVNLSQLVLNNNKISILPKKICNLALLKYLSVPYNELYKIPKEILELNNLCEISLNKNNYRDTHPLYTPRRMLEYMRENGDLV